MKLVFTTIIITLITISANCQTLIRQQLTQEDSVAGVYRRYEHPQGESFVWATLLLKKDGTYRYRMGACVESYLSEGRWKRTGKTVALESFLQKDNIPAEICYEGNSTIKVDSNVIDVENSLQHLVFGAYVLVNGDSVKCLASMGLCNGSFTTIDSVKLQYENGMSSAWMKVQGKHRKIGIRVLTDADIGKYLVFHEQVCRMRRRYLRM